jgi:hypothetical protein
MQPPAARGVKVHMRLHNHPQHASPIQEQTAPVQKAIWLFRHQPPTLRVISGRQASDTSVSSGLTTGPAVLVPARPAPTAAPAAAAAWL